MVKPYLIRKGRIPCPLKAEMMKRSGKVTGRVIVNKDGRYKFQEIIEETPPNFGFAGAFKAFLEQSDGFKPATLNGKPVSVYYNVTLVWNK